MSKGDSDSRITNRSKYRSNFDMIFRSPIAPPTEVHKDKKKEASKKACRTKEE
jgi:hypothetical protein